MAKFFVIDTDGHVSWFTHPSDDSKSGPEKFGTESKAIKRAMELADANPGFEVFVAKAIKSVVAPVAQIDVKDL